MQGCLCDDDSSPSQNVDSYKKQDNICRRNNHQQTISIVRASPLRRVNVSPDARQRRLACLHAGVFSTPALSKYRRYEL